MSIKKIALLFVILLISFFYITGQKAMTDKKTFSFWTVQLKAPAGDLIQKNINTFKKNHPDIEVIWVDIPISEVKKRTIASILGGNPPDLINLNPEYSLVLAQKGALEYFSKEDIEPYNSNIIKKLTYENKIYALPFYATSAVTILNKKKFTNCNIKIKTYDDIPALKSCKNPPLFAIALNEGDTFLRILNKYNVKNSANLNDVYLKFYKMKKEGLLPEDTLVINHREAVEKYMAQTAGYAVMGSNFITMVKENAPSVYENSVVEPQITGSNGQYDISLMNFVIPKKAKNKDLALEFAFLLLNEENQLEFAKKTNVLPVNKNALNNDYFKVCGEDLIDKARCIAAYQLNNPLIDDFNAKNKQEVDEILNNALEELFLKNNFDPDTLWKNLGELLNSK